MIQRTLMTFVILSSFIELSMAAGNLTDSPENANLIYNPLSGNLVLDPDHVVSGQIIGFDLTADEGNFFRSANVDVPIASDPNTGASLAWDQICLGCWNANDFEIEGVVGIFGWIGIDKPFNLGDVMPTGLTAATLQASLIKADFASSFSRRASGDFDLIVGNIDGPHADLLYDIATGNVTLDASDTANGVIISFVLGTGQNNMRPENLVNSADGSAGPFFDVGTNTDATSFQIGATDPLNQGVGPLVDLGDILPPGMDWAELAEYLTLREYASELGMGGQLDLFVIPEPSSATLFLLGMIIFSRIRLLTSNHQFRQYR